MAVETYIPEKGDIIWIDFNPSAGKEIQKRRPGLVVSSSAFNQSTHFAVICPITSTIKDYPTRFNLTSSAKTKGQVLNSQLKSLDFIERKGTFIEKVSMNELEQINQLVSFVFE